MCSSDLVFGRIFACVSFCRSLDLGKEFFANNLRFVEELLAQRWDSGNGTSEVWRFLKTFGDLYNPCHLIIGDPQTDVVHPRLVVVVGFV